MASDPAVLDAFDRYRATGDRDVRNQLIQQHHWIAVHCARRFANRGEPLDDLIQVGQLGVLKAVDRFDPEIGLSFTAFAMPTVLGELRRYFRDSTWAVRVPRRIKELHVELGATVEFLTNKLGRAPRVGELASHMGVDEETVLDAIEAGNAYRSAPLVPVGDENHVTSDAEAVGIDDEELSGMDLRVDVRRLLRRLQSRERRIVYLRFFEGLSQSEIAEQVGVSQVHVSRLLRASIESLRCGADDEHPD
jgi:RNA polymerase sigma-B factor